MPRFSGLLAALALGTLSISLVGGDSSAAAGFRFRYRMHGCCKAGMCRDNAVVSEGAMCSSPGSSGGSEPSPPPQQTESPAPAVAK